MVKTSPSNGGCAGSFPGRRAKIPHAAGPKKQNIKQKQHCNKFNKDFESGPHKKNLKKKNHRMGGLSNKHVFLIILGAGKSKIKALAEPVSGESALPDL